MLVYCPSQINCMQTKQIITTENGSSYIYDCCGLEWKKKILELQTHNYKKIVQCTRLIGMCYLYYINPGTLHYATIIISEFVITIRVRGLWEKLQVTRGQLYIPVCIHG